MAKSIKPKPTPRKVGRPLEYSADIHVTKVKKYMSRCVDRTSKKGKTTVDLPSIEGLAVYMDIDRTTIYDWQKKFPEFSHIIGKLLALQAKKLINNGLNRRYSPTITKLILSKHGYIERQQVEQSGGVTNVHYNAEITAEEAKRIAKALREEV